MDTFLPRVAFWLVPSPATRARWQGMIEQLAAELDAPVFAPHVTLYSCQRSVDDRERVVLKSMAKRFGPISLVPTGLETSIQFTRCLYLMFRDHPRLTRLHREIHAAVTNPSCYALAPHLSLLYHVLSEDIRRRLIMTLSVPAEPVTFTDVQLVAIPEFNGTPADVAYWEVLESHPLDGHYLHTTQPGAGV